MLAEAMEARGYGGARAHPLAAAGLARAGERVVLALGPSPPRPSPWRSRGDHFRYYDMLGDPMTTVGLARDVIGCCAWPRPRWCEGRTAVNASIRIQSVRYRYPARRAGAGQDRPDRRAGGARAGAGRVGLRQVDAAARGPGLVPSFHGGELAGRVVTEGLNTREHPVAEIAMRAGLVFQDPEAQLVMRRADREVAFGLENLGCPAHEIAARAEQALAAVAAAHLAERDSGTLSGGEQQRIAIASVLAMGQRLLLLDEPTSQLDPWRPRSCWR